MFRPNVLLNLSLPGTRIGDEGATALAPTLAGIRSVDLRCNNIGDVGTIAIASALSRAVAAAAAEKENALAADSTSDERMFLGEKRTKRLCVLERLSLAGNRIEDGGLAALSDMLEADKEGQYVKKRLNNDGQNGGRHASAAAASAAPAVAPPAVASPSVTSPVSPPPLPEGFQFLGWLSVAGNPGISDDARERLLRAGSNRRVVLRGSGGDGENDPPAMVIIA